MVEAAQNGNNDAFKILMEMYEPKVAATIIGMLGKCSEAEDIGQETFMRFYKSLKRFKGESSVGTYLIRIAINLSINELKRRQRRAKFFLVSSKPEIEMESFPAKPSLLSPNPEEEETKVIVRQAIQQLAPKFRSVIVLRLIDGYSTNETARILKLPIGTVLSRLARGQMKLKKILGPSLFPGDQGQHDESSLFNEHKPPRGSISPGKRLIGPLPRGVLMEGKNE